MSDLPQMLKEATVEVARVQSVSQWQWTIVAQFPGAES